MEVQQQQQQQPLPPVTISGGMSSSRTTGDIGPQNENQRMENESDVIFYMEEPKANTPIVLDAITGELKHQFFFFTVQQKY